MKSNERKLNENSTKTKGSEKKMKGIFFFEKIIVARGAQRTFFAEI